jgi:hypothetical protein
MKCKDLQIYFGKLEKLFSVSIEKGNQDV